MKCAPWESVRVKSIMRDYCHLLANEQGHLRHRLFEFSLLLHNLIKLEKTVVDLSRGKGKLFLKDQQRLDVHNT